MRYFFHIVDRYGVYPDRIGYEHADQHAAMLHAGRIAAELAKAGELFRMGFVFVGRAAVPWASCAGAPSVTDFLPSLSTEKP